MAKKTSTPASPDFQQFWDAYGLKRDRVAAERAWRKLSKGDRRAALAGIQRYRADCEARGISRMYAQGYLNHRRWEDEADTDPAPVERGGTAANDIPQQGGARVAGIPLQGEQKGADLPDMALW